MADVHTVKKKSSGKSGKASKAKGTTSNLTPFKALNQTIDMEKTMTQSKAQYEKLTKDVTNVGGEYVETIVKATNIWLKGSEAFLKTYMEITQDSAERNSQAIKSLVGCKTLNEWTEAQNRLVQENFDDLMTGATKLSELTVKITTEAFEPINTQLSKTIKKAGQAVAA